MTTAPAASPALDRRPGGWARALPPLSAVIAAVVVGGTALSGGRGSLFGTLLGVLVITLIGNGLVLLGINSFFQQVVRGVIIVVAVLANILLTQRSSKAKR